MAEVASAQRESAKAWLVWGAGAAFFAYAFLHRIAPAAMYDRLMAEFQVSAAALGNLSACYFYAYGALQLPVGLLLDRFGPRLLLCGSALLAAGGSLAFAWAESLQAAYLGRLLIGAGSGASFVGALTLAMQSLPPSRFGLVAGLTQAIALGGTVVAQAPLAALVAAVGWRETMLGFAAAGLVMGALIWQATRAAQAPALRSRTGARGAAGAVLRNPQTALACLYCGLMSAPAIAFAVLWGAPWFAQAHGLARTEAAFGASMPLLGWAVCAPAIGWLSERMGGRKPIMIAAAAVALAAWSALLLWSSAPFAAACGLLLVLGGAHGAMALSFVVAREANPQQAAAFATSVANFSSIATIALVQPLVGWLLDLQWEGAMADGVRVFSPAAWRLALLLFPAACLIALLGAIALKETHPARAAKRRLDRA